MQNYEEFGRRIAMSRKARGYTQEQLAALLHITGQAVSKWEKSYALPDTSLLPALSKVLNVSIDHLLMGQEPESPYDEEYSREEHYWGLVHSELAEMVVTIYDTVKQGSRLLEIGSGEGRDAIYFAK